MMDALREVLERDSRVVYALIFGSHARGSSHAGSDLDVALGLRAGIELSSGELGDLVSTLERAAGRSVDVLLLDAAPAPIAFRVFRDGVVIVEKEHQAQAARRAQAVIEYLDFRVTEDLLTHGALNAASHGR